MKLLHSIDQKDYDENLPSRRREAVRAIIFVDGKLALIQSKMYGECKFIGGGIEENESPHRNACTRSTRGGWVQDYSKFNQIIRYDRRKA